MPYRLAVALLSSAAMLGFMLGAHASTVVCNTANGGTCLGNVSVTLGHQFPVRRTSS
jgi:hypothetical protein